MLLLPLLVALLFLGVGDGVGSEVVGVKVAGCCVLRPFEDELPEPLVVAGGEVVEIVGCSDVGVSVAVGVGVGVLEAGVRDGVGEGVGSVVRVGTTRGVCVGVGVGAGVGVGDWVWGGAAVGVGVCASRVGVGDDDSADSDDAVAITACSGETVPGHENTASKVACRLAPPARTWQFGSDLSLVAAASDAHAAFEQMLAV